MTGYYYLATEYSKYSGGLEAAFEMAAQQAALLIRAGIGVFSPIAHTHPIAKFGGMDPLDHAIWLPADEPMMHGAIGIVVVCSGGWANSYGIGVEIKAFEAAAKPCIYMKPGEVPPELLALTIAPTEP